MRTAAVEDDGIKVDGRRVVCFLFNVLFVFEFVIELELEFVSTCLLRLVFH